MKSNYVVLKPIHISAGIIPVGRNLIPGDFGILENALEEMVDAGLVRRVSKSRVSVVQDREKESD
jgi:hypothetical protein